MSPIHAIIVVLLLLLLPLILLLRSRKETYSLDHAILNTHPPKTLWLNMGYWKVTSLSHSHPPTRQTPNFKAER